MLNKKTNFNMHFEKEKLRTRKNIEKKESIIKKLKNEIISLKSRVTKIKNQENLNYKDNTQSKRSYKVDGQKIDKLE
jgi:hypothetical protein